MATKKITLKELKILVKQIKKEYINENEQEDLNYAKEYVDELYEKYNGNYKKIHQHIINHLVNNEYYIMPNSLLMKVWDALNAKFPS